MFGRGINCGFCRLAENVGLRECVDAFGVSGMKHLNNHTISIGFRSVVYALS